MKYADLLDYAAQACGIEKTSITTVFPEGVIYNFDDEITTGFTIYCNEGRIVFNEKTES